MRKFSNLNSIEIQQHDAQVLQKVFFLIEHQTKEKGILQLKKWLGKNAI